MLSPEVAETGTKSRLAEVEPVGHLPALIGDQVEPLAGKRHQVHLVHRDHDAADAEHRHDEQMPARLRGQALARIKQDDGNIRRGSAGRHVAGILLVARRIGDDERAAPGRKVPVGDVDGDALLALGGKSVDQQGEIDLVAAAAVAGRILDQICQFVVAQALRIVEQPAEQRRLSVVDRTGDDEPEQVRALARRRARFDEPFVFGAARCLIEYQRFVHQK